MSIARWLLLRHRSLACDRLEIVKPRCALNASRHSIAAQRPLPILVGGPSSWHRSSMTGSFVAAGPFAWVSNGSDHHFDHHLGLSTEIRPSAKALFLRKIGRLRTSLDTLPVSGGQRALSPDLVDSVTVMILCRTSKVRELLVDFLLAFGMDGYGAALRQIRPVAVVRDMSNELLAKQALFVTHSQATARQLS
jgi:hypothetical protein